VKRFIVQADDDLIRRVKKRAAQRGVSVAQVVREALEDALGRGRPLPSFIGKYRSHGVGPPAAEIDDKYVAEPYKSDMPDKR
jgi:ribbon-helix-helix CopG family protein